MPLIKERTKEAFEKNVAELIRSYKRKGTIGRAHPKSLAKARKMAVAIAFQVRRGK